MQAADALFRPCMAQAALPRQRLAAELPQTAVSSRCTGQQSAPLTIRAQRHGRRAGESLHRQRLRGSQLQAAVVGDGLTESQQQQQQQQQAGGSAGALGAAAVAAASGGAAAAVQQQHSLVVAPEDFQLQQGELSYVERGAPLSPADAFRCAACTRPECQVRPNTPLCLTAG